MQAEDLNHEELLELDAETGRVRFAGQRALLVDAVALGLHRKYLVESFGRTAARAVLTQFGFAHGWRLAAALGDQLKWPNRAEWRCAGARVCMLEGLFRTEPGTEDPLAPAGATLLASYEAEQHLLHFGRSDSVVCWTICGLLSGYASRIEDKEIFVLEDRCLGQGHATCHVAGREREEWGEDRAADLELFDRRPLPGKLDASLTRVMKNLRSVEDRLASRRRELESLGRDAKEPLGVVAKSSSMRKVIDLARRVAAVDATVLITGESGVGKERVARLVHDESMRAAGSFIAVNCGAISEPLLESELFGHARGSFTGAVSDRAGLFEAANRGTLLLDEIGEVSPGMQVKLLRVLQEREIRRVGENEHRAVDARIIAATNRDLAPDADASSFRQDLYYRLKVVELHVPPLRERRDDILPLARVLLAAAATRMGREIEGLTPAAADQLLRYPWPGNVRELENAMERAVALARGQRVDLDDLPEDVRQTPPRPGPARQGVQPLSEVEKDYILATLEKNHGHRSLTAKQLEIGDATLQRKLKKYGLTRRT